MFGEAGLEQIIITAGYFGIFSLMILNGTFSFPSSQILYIVSGYFIFQGDLTLGLVAFLGALGNTIGNTVLFYLTREKGLEYITKLTLIPITEIHKVQIVFKKHGNWYLFIGKLLPAIKVFMPIVAGVGKMSMKFFVPIVFISSFIWSLIFISIGYYFGKSSDVFGTYAIILLILAAILVFLFYRYMNSTSVLKELKKSKMDE